MEFRSNVRFLICLLLAGTGASSLCAQELQHPEPRKRIQRPEQGPDATTTEPESADPRVVVHFDSGKPVVGEFTRETLPTTTLFGILELRVDRLRSISKGNPHWKFVFRNGDTIEGNLAPKVLQFQTTEGKVKLETSMIREIWCQLDPKTDTLAQLPESTAERIEREMQQSEVRVFKLPIDPTRIRRRPIPPESLPFDADSEKLGTAKKPSRDLHREAIPREGASPRKRASRQ